jgi:mRNA-decapping enzyme subunit 2
LPRLRLTCGIQGLDDLCVRFIINLPPEELESVERICFQVEEAQWFYEDFIRPLDPHLPSLSLRAFSLRIFQHCPLFSQWSAQHHTTAFAEFLAYKSRVPVRGAIILNEAMDEVVLVKGWKKGASWSFPRGKINKDEDDLDCAIREVYEETGYDIKAAGLVKEPKDMKFIEVTMREQHMRLYVFRGVPKETHFEPRTRKEISKIEWYKLTDLPTLKRHKHQDSNGGNLAINANKFYMVAPFLGPLKSWIAQQRKQDKRRSSQPASLAPPPLAEETVTEDEIDIKGGPQKPGLLKAMSHGPSDLPEVSLLRAQDGPVDPSSHLEMLLNTNINRPQQELISPMRKAPPNVDSAKSSALLALLRGDSTAELRAGPNTPLEQMSFPSDVHRSPGQLQPHQTSFSYITPPAPYPISPDENRYRQQIPRDQHSIFRHQPQFDVFKPEASMAPPDLAPTVAPAFQQFARPVPPVSPYQRTGDSKFSHQQTGEPRISFVPPASALPKLTTHTRALLDVFKTGHPVAQRGPEAADVPSTRLPRGIVTTTMPERTRSQLEVSIQTPWSAADSTPTSRALVHHITDKSLPSTVVHRPKSAQQASLLDLFRQSSIDVAPASSAVPQATSQNPPVELAASSTIHRSEAKISPVDDSLNLLKKGSEAGKTHIKKRTGARTVGEGETSATVSGPLNQPHFDGILKPRKQASNGLGRSPVASDRTLYDPKQPTPIKILARPDDNKRSPARSPRASKAVVAAPSPKRTPMPREQVKPFQPQILRRPQTVESQSAATPAISIMATKSQTASCIEDLPKSSTPVETQPMARRSISRQPSDANTHRQTLLSLFNQPASTTDNPTTPRTFQIPQDVVSPLMTNQMVKPLEERSVHGMEPISTRSRVGSLASIASSSIRPPIEKRQTTAGDKAFLLGYLGRIASREGE